MSTMLNEFAKYKYCEEITTKDEFASGVMKTYNSQKQQPERPASKKQLFNELPR